jgi:hypothetical protein
MPDADVINSEIEHSYLRAAVGVTDSRISQSTVVGGALREGSSVEGSEIGAHFVTRSKITDYHRLNPCPGVRNYYRVTFWVEVDGCEATDVDARGSAKSRTYRGRIRNCTATPQEESPYTN